MNTIFVDTSAWIAVMDVREGNHSRAKEFYLELLKSRMRIVTSNYVLAESYTRIRYDKGYRETLAFHTMVANAEKLGHLKILWVDHAVADAAWEILEKYSNQTFSFTDCTSFALLRENKVDEVFAFDDDFRLMGFAVRP